MADTGIPFLDSIIGTLGSWGAWFDNRGGSIRDVIRGRQRPAAPRDEIGTLSQLRGPDEIPQVRPRPSPPFVPGGAAPAVPSPQPLPPVRPGRRSRPARRGRPLRPRRSPVVPGPVRPEAPPAPRPKIITLPKLPGGINPIDFVFEEWRRYLEPFPRRPTPGGGPRRGGARTRVPPPKPPQPISVPRVEPDDAVLGDINVRGMPETLEEYLDRTYASIFDERRNRMLEVGVDPSTEFSDVPWEVFRQPGMDPTPNANPRTFTGPGVLPAPSTPPLFNVSPLPFLLPRQQPRVRPRSQPRQQRLREPSLRELQPRNLTPSNNPALGLQPTLGRITVAEPTSDPCAVRARDARRRQRRKRKQCKKFVYKRIKVCQSSNAK